jgi:hypothetical protein
MNKKILSNLTKNLKGLSEDFKKLSIDLHKDINSNPSSEGVEVKKDILELVNHIKSGNFEEAMKLRQKYADNFSK